MEKSVMPDTIEFFFDIKEDGSCLNTLVEIYADLVSWRTVEWFWWKANCSSLILPARDF